MTMLANFPGLLEAFFTDRLMRQRQVRIPLIVNADSGIVNSDSADRDHAVGAKRR